VFHAKTISLHLKSGPDGVAHVAYDAALCEPGWVWVAKEGYQARSRYVLNRKLDAQDVSFVARSDGASQLGELRELLAGGFSLEREQFDDLAKRSCVLRCVT